MDYLKNLYETMDKIKEQETERKQRTEKSKHTFKQPLYGFQSHEPIISAEPQEDYFTSDMHSGHRERLTDLIANAGIEKVSEYQAVEYFLTHIFPRGDVNPLAHALLAKFGCFANILEADEHEIAKIKGFNERSARKIANFLSLTKYYTLSKLRAKLNITQREEILSFLESLMRLDTVENLYIFAINNAGYITQHRHHQEKDAYKVAIDNKDIVNFISSSKATSLLFVHSHPNGVARPSIDDDETTEKLKAFLPQFNCRFFDSIIVGFDGIYSSNQQDYLRFFKNAYGPLD